MSEEQVQQAQAEGTDATPPEGEGDALDDVLNSLSREATLLREEEGGEGEEQPKEEGGQEPGPQAVEGQEQVQESVAEPSGKEQLPEEGSETESKAEEGEAKGEEEPATEPELSQEEIQQRYQAWREQVLDRVAQEQYQLTEEEIEAISTQPEEAIPRLLSRVYLDAVQGAMQAIMMQMPQLVQNTLQQKTQAEQAEEQFFSKWGKLRDEKYYDDIRRVAQAYRATDPNLPTERLMDLVGVQVSLLHGLPIESVEGQQAQQTETPQAPPQPVGLEGVAESTARQARDDNPFATLAEEMMEDDR